VSSHQKEDFLFDFENGDDCISYRRAIMAEVPTTRIADIIGLY